MASSSFRTSLSSLGLTILVACVAPADESDPSRAFLEGAGNDAIVVRDGETQPIYAYGEAVRESVWVEASIDSDGDGQPDRIALDIVRPKTAPGAKVAIVMEASPYYRIPSAKPAERAIPLGHRHWHDKYFVERGYATVEVEMQGTARSTGCPKTGGTEDTASIVAAIDWLNGRARAFYADGQPAVAGWSTGAVGMVGVSYNGTLPIAVAAEGVQGLKTIIPIAAISSWYDYARDDGIAYAGWDERYPQWLAEFVLSEEAKVACAASTTKLGDDAGDDTFDFTPFWEERDYRKNIDRITASVFIVHGLRDDNVKLRHFGRLWDGLQARNAPRKLWLHNDGHTDPVSLRPIVWKDTMHHWMDRWLYGIANDVMKEPVATIQRPNGSWEDHTSWPETGSVATPLYTSSENTLETQAAVDASTHTLTDDPLKTEVDLVSQPAVNQPFRLAYRGAPLTSPVRISGTPRAHVAASSDTTSTPFSVLLVDYGETSTWAPENLSLKELMEPTCTLSDIDRALNGCASPRRRLFATAPQVIVTRGSIDVKNRLSLTQSAPLTPGEIYEVEWDMQPADYVFAAGHRIGVVVSANNSEWAAVDPTAHQLSVSLDRTRVILPVAP